MIDGVCNFGKSGNIERFASHTFGKAARGDDGGKLGFRNVTDDGGKGIDERFASLRERTLDDLEERFFVAINRRA